MANGSLAELEFSVRLVGVPLERYGLVVVGCYGALFVVGTLANAWVAWVVGSVVCCGQAVERVPRSVLWYIFSLCLADLLIMLVMPLLLLDLLYGKWLFGDFLCLFYIAVDALNKFASPFILAALSYTCYAVTHRGAEAASRLRTGVGVTALCFGLALVLICPVFLNTRVRQFELGYNTSTLVVYILQKCVVHMSESEGVLFNGYSCAIGYALPTSCFVYFYARLIYFVYRHTRTDSLNTLCLWRISKTVLALVLVYVFCYTPYWVFIWVSMLLLGSQPTYVVVVAGYFVHLLPYVSCSVYPVIYTLLNRGIQAAHARVAQRQRRSFYSALQRLEAPLIRLSLSSAGSTRTLSISSPFRHSSRSLSHSQCDRDRHAPQEMAYGDTLDCNRLQLRTSNPNIRDPTEATFLLRKNVYESVL